MLVEECKGEGTVDDVRRGDDANVKEAFRGGEEFGWMVDELRKA